MQGEVLRLNPLLRQGLQGLLEQQPGVSLGAGYRSAPGPWSARDVGLASLLADHAAIAVRTADLLDSSRRQVHGLSLMVRSLRAQAHEHANRMHAIYGLLVLGEVDDARRLVAAVEEGYHSVYGTVVSRIENTTVAGLLVAESAIALQSGIEIVLERRSRLTSCPRRWAISTPSRFLAIFFTTRSKPFPRPRPRGAACGSRCSSGMTRRSLGFVTGVLEYRPRTSRTRCGATTRPKPATSGWVCIWSAPWSPAPAGRSRSSECADRAPGNRDVQGMTAAHRCSRTAAPSPLSPPPGANDRFCSKPPDGGPDLGKVVAMAAAAATLRKSACGPDRFCAIWSLTGPGIAASAAINTTKHQPACEPSHCRHRKPNSEPRPTGEAIMDRDAPWRVLVVEDDHAVASLHQRLVESLPGFRSLGVVSDGDAGRIERSTRCGPISRLSIWRCPGPRPHAPAPHSRRRRARRGDCRHGVPRCEDSS